MRKITVEVPTDLLEKAQEETGHGVTDTVREGLELLQRRRAYRRLKELRGKVKFSMTWQEMKEDRE
ncbi:MAG TPA: hypothetical protein VEH07_02155 [Alphaproteobacteria bacterium]|nr:hypothetical protein [Alphaproteobacteria bacterium]